jgi:hypothetical protein
MKSSRRDFLLGTAAATLLPTLSTPAANSAPSRHALWSKQEPFPTPERKLFYVPNVFVSDNWGRLKTSYDGLPSPSDAVLS